MMPARALAAEIAGALPADVDDVHKCKGADPRAGSLARQPSDGVQAQTASFRSLAARKATFLLALILMASPVAGLRPMRAGRLRTCRMPRPPMRMRAPRFRCLVMVADHVLEHGHDLLLGQLVGFRQASRQAAQRDGLGLCRGGIGSHGSIPLLVEDEASTISRKPGIQAFFALIAQFSIVRTGGRRRWGRTERAGTGLRTTGAPKAVLGVPLDPKGRPARRWRPRQVFMLR